MRTTTILQKQAQARKGQNADRYCLARPINGISLNGEEYLLDEDNEIMWFETDIDAYMFCYDNLDHLALPNPYERRCCYISELEEYDIFIRAESEVQDA